MINTFIKTILFAVLLISTAHAAVSPLGISIVDPVQFPPSDFDIMGARASLVYGKNRDVTGIDLGVVGNVTTGNFKGSAISGLFNSTKGQSTILGVQLAGLGNFNSEKVSVYGIQAALLTNYNSAESSVVGLQFSVANISPNTTVNGFQVGIYNKARHVRGLQIGLINMTQNLTGIQIGLLNFYQEGFFKVAPILNIGF